MVQSQATEVWPYASSPAIAVRLSNRSVGAKNLPGDHSWFHCGRCLQSQTREPAGRLPRKTSKQKDVGDESRTIRIETINATIVRVATPKYSPDKFVTPLDGSPTLEQLVKLVDSGFGDDDNSSHFCA
jgi:hypothetical protein